MKLQEQIYTSASELLESGAGNLGVLARTRGFPPDAAGELSTQQAYTLLPGLPLEPLNAHPPRLVIGVCGSSKQYLGISQTVYAGADHTGRTRPFTHHLLIRRADIAPGAPGVPHAAVIRAVLPLLKRAWDGPPAWIEPERQVALPPGLPASFPSDAWSEVLPASVCEPTLCHAADVLAAFPSSRRPLLICLPQRKARRVAELIADLLWLLPASIQAELTAVSHVVEASDYIRDAALLVTYPSTPFLTQTLERQDPRKPVVLDLATAGEASTASLGAYGQELHAAWRSGQPARLAAVGQQWDLWGFKSEQAGLFATARKLERHLAQAANPAQLSDLAAGAAQLPAQLRLTDHVDRCCRQAVDRFEHQSQAARWDCLLAIYGDSRWPAGARQRALQAIAAGAGESLPYLLGKTRQAKDCDPRVSAHLDQLRNSQLGREWLAAAEKTSPGPTVPDALSSAALAPRERERSIGAPRADLPDRPAPSRRPPQGVALARRLFWAAALLTVGVGGLALAAFFELGRMGERGLLGQWTWQVGAGAFAISMIYELGAGRVLRDRRRLLAGRTCVLLLLVFVLLLILPYGPLLDGIGSGVEFVRGWLPQRSEPSK